MSGRPGLPLKLPAAEYQNAGFDISVDGGRFLLWEAENYSSAKEITCLAAAFAADNNTALYWTNHPAPPDLQATYVDIVVRDGEDIVGYIVLKIYTGVVAAAPAQRCFYAMMLKSVSAPMVNGKLQAISIEYVASERERVKAGAEAPAF